jgi:hypothetical protein
VHRSAIALSTLAAACLAACTSTPKPQSPAPEAAAAPAAAAPAAGAPAAPGAPSQQRTLAGEWAVRISSAQQGSISSMMRLVARGDGYIGLLQPLLNAQGESAIQGAGPSPFQIRSATLEGARATIVVDFDGDEGRIVASFRGANLLDGTLSSRALSGRITLQRR